MYQQTIIIGYLGNDPELRFTPGGSAVCNMSVATNRKIPNSDGTNRDETTWFRVAVWGAQAEACNQYLHKGSKVFALGTLKPDENGNPRIWTGNDGAAHTSFELNANFVKFLDSRQESQQQQSRANPNAAPSQSRATGGSVGGGGWDNTPQDEFDEPQDTIPF